MEIIQQLPKSQQALFFVLCFCAGAVNGLFGMGGGILIFFLLTHIYAGAPAFSTKDIFASTVLCVFIMSLSSVFLYAQKNYYTVRDLLPFLLPAALGGIAGALLLDVLNADFLKKIFAVLMLWGGISLLLK